MQWCGPADGSASYSFDANGNRTMAGYATSTGNRTTNDGTWTYTFDDAGNEIKKSKGAAAETWNYLYDNRNQLIAAEKHATDGGALLAKVLNKYDALGDRIERDEDTDGNGTYETVERFAYDGWKVHQDAGGGQAGFIGQENFDVWADLNGSNVLTTRRQQFFEARRPQRFVGRKPADRWVENAVRIVGEVRMQGRKFPTLDSITTPNSPR